MNSFIYFILTDSDTCEFVSSTDEFYNYIFFELPNCAVFYWCDLGVFLFIDNKLFAFSVKCCII